MSLSSKQRAFVRMVGLLIEHAYQQGYELTFGDAFRDPRLHGAVGVKAGYGAASAVPDCVKNWMLVRISMLLANRDAIALNGSGLAAIEASPFIDSILDPERVTARITGV